ncbi:aromatic alcohol reductase [Pseudoroseomonas wenyumeiae]
MFHRSPCCCVHQGASNPASSGATAFIRDLGIDIVEADLAAASVNDLAAIFSRFTQVVCCTGFVGGPGTQRKITAAVIAAGVAHYVPWQFGVDYDVIGRGSGQEVWDEQLDVRDMLRAQSKVCWTIISTGMFTSFVFLPAFGLANLEQNRVHALGDWDFGLTVTTPEDIGRVTALVVASPSEFSDQVVYAAGDTFTYRELADTVDQVLNTRVDRILLTVPELRSEVSSHPTDTMRKYRLAFARPDGVAWPKSDTLNAERGMAMVDVATWLRRWRDLNGAPVSR